MILAMSISCLLPSCLVAERFGFPASTSEYGCRPPAADIASRHAGIPTWNCGALVTGQPRYQLSSNFGGTRSSIVNGHDVDLRDFAWQAVELSQMHAARWPRNRFGQYATIAELMTAATRPSEVHRNHHDPHLSFLRQ
jgi:hypothetical protein